MLFYIFKAKWGQMWDSLVIMLETLILRLDLVNCVRKVLVREHIHKKKQWYLFHSF